MVENTKRDYVSFEAFSSFTELNVTLSLSRSVPGFSFGRVLTVRWKLQPLKFSSSHTLKKSMRALPPRAPGARGPPPRYLPLQGFSIASALFLLYIYMFGRAMAKNEERATRATERYFEKHSTRKSTQRPVFPVANFAASPSLSPSSPSFSFSLSMRE